jgi:sulfate adenylyltransferase subunit 1 (EFTu-like GTPase family)
MQCLDPDPGAPKYGISRVVRLVDLLRFLEKSENNETLNFLTKESVTMLNDHSSSSWSGCVVAGQMIRYHPETLRAAARRQGHSEGMLENQIAAVAKAALAVSQPLNLDRGDILLLSNHRTLHYRGECSVVFTKYPTEFVSRSVFILHATEELKPR